MILELLGVIYTEARSITLGKLETSPNLLLLLIVHLLGDEKTVLERNKTSLESIYLPP